MIRNEHFFGGLLDLSCKLFLLTSLMILSHPFTYFLHIPVHISTLHPIKHIRDLNPKFPDTGFVHSPIILCDY